MLMKISLFHFFFLFLFLNIIEINTSKIPFDIKITQVKTAQSNFPFLHISNCDKDGSITLKRIASCMGGISDTRDINLSQDNLITKTYFIEIADKFVNQYKKISQDKQNSTLQSIPLDFSTIVLGTPHRASLYIAETLHCPLLSMQYIGWAKDLDHAAETLTVTGIAGWDYDNNNLWLWLKITEVEHIPQSYRDLIENATNLIIVRSNSHPELPEKYLGKYKNIYLHSSLQHQAKFLDSINKNDIKPIDDEEFKTLKQWEWGLPDSSITAIKKYWVEILKKPAENLKIFDKGVLNLFRSIPILWLKYLEKNKCKPRGISFNPYWTANPLYERIAGIVPLDYYNFGVFIDFYQKIVDDLKKKNYLPNPKLGWQPPRVYAFMNLIETQVDLDRVKDFWTKNQLFDVGYFSVGLDIKDLKSKDLYDKNVSPPYQSIMNWISKTSNIPYNSKIFQSLTIEEVEKVINDFQDP